MTGARERKAIMGLENTRNKKLLYHLTKLDNMASIVQYGLLPRAQVRSMGLEYHDVADSGIISKREELGLDGFVPFHFHPYTAFDRAVKNSYPDDKFVYITIKRDLAALANFKILTKHPLSLEECILYDYNEGFNKIDWDTLERVGADDAYSRNVKMAECLSDQAIAPSLIQCVYVSDEWAKEYVEQLFWDQGITEQPPYVSVMEVFF
ncbi:MAG: DUF4433 domain-containing protein [Lachnospiraceae bacterium]|nr:DUF4433 domain-containing protein [Lachnospiraceae bacterium]